MSHDDIERALATDDIVPSSGFTAAVMTAVRAEAAAPPPIPFPWARALVSLGMGAAAIVAMAMWMLRAPAAGTSRVVPEALTAIAAPVTRLAATQEAQLIVGALVLTYLLVEIPRRVFRL